MLHAVKPFIDFYRIASSAPAADPDRDVRRFWRGLTLGWNAARRYRRLQLMSDRELERLGLDRASIGRHAFFGDEPFGQG